MDRQGVCDLSVALLLFVLLAFLGLVVPVALVALSERSKCFLDEPKDRRIQYNAATMTALFVLGTKLIGIRDRSSDLKHRGRA